MKNWLVCSAIVAVLCTFSCTKVTPAPDPQPVEVSVSLNFSLIELAPGEVSSPIVVTLEPSDAEVDIRMLVTDESIAILDGNCVKAVAPGKTTVWVFAGNAEASCDVVVEAVKPQAVNLSDTQVDLRKGESCQLVATLSPDGAEGTVMWSSDDEKVVKVSQDGLVNAVGYGKTRVVARCGVISAECVFTVEPDAPKIGDYFYSDGSWSDGGLISMDEFGMNAKWADPRPAPEEGKTVIGIVFQTNPDRIYADDVRAGYAHGYVVSTHIAHYEGSMDTMYSRDEGIDCLNNCKTGKSYYSNLKGSWETWQVYGTYKLSGTANVPAFKLVVEDFTPAPESTSGWFLPSTGQLWDMVANFCGDEVAEYLKPLRTLGYDVTYERGVSASYGAIDKFNEMSALVPASMKDDLYVPPTEAYHNYCGIWSSTLYDNSDGAGALFYIGGKGGRTLPCCDWVDNAYFVKPILAF